MGIKEKEKQMRVVIHSVSTCTSCMLHKTRTRAVPGYGNLDADIVLVGEAPGEQENWYGHPFVGFAGGRLTEALNRVGLDRSEVYITNVVKCHPPANRTPGWRERALCGGFFLCRELAIVQPKLVVSLGAAALKFFMGEDAKITELHGSLIEREEYSLWPTFHPAAIYRDAWRVAFEQDMVWLKILIERVLKDTEDD